MSEARQFEGDTLLIATHNLGKVPEIMALLPGHIINVTNSRDQNLPEPVEDGKDFVENALIKARDAAKRSGLISLADDSGLCVVAMGGEPGHLSARWAGPEKDFTAAMQRVLDALGDNPDRRAYFVCVLALAWPDGNADYVEGRVYGTIALERRGDKGFGYDAIFIPDGHAKAFAEDPSLKDTLSHRVDAFRKLNEKCFRKTPLSCTIG